MAIELGVITSCAVFNPVFSTFSLEMTPRDRVVRTLSAGSVTGKLTTAALTAVWGLLATFTGTREAIALAGLLLATPLLLRRRPATVPEASQNALRSSAGSP